MRVLILGGTAEARALAARLVDLGHQTTSSLAGRVSRPRLPVGTVRIGGFGGVCGLRSAATEFEAVIDATHPFAAGISANAAQACADVPLLRLERPPWEQRDDWHMVDGHDQAALTAAGLGHRPLLTVGRQSLTRFTEPLGAYAVLARVVDTPDVNLPPGWQLLHDRGPYTLEGELDLMDRHRADVLVTKDSGGTHTFPKLDAAARLGVEVVVVRRPPPPAGVQVVSDVQAVVDWLTQVQEAP